MTIRPMESADLAACADILMSVYNNELWQCRWTADAALEYLSDLFQARKFVGYVALQQDEIVGSIFAREKVWWNNSEVFVEEMFVKPKFQKMGYGSMLLKEIEGYVAEKGLAGITLSTNKYAPAPLFYRKNGFLDCEHVIFMAKEML